MKSKWLVGLACLFCLLGTPRAEVVRELTLHFQSGARFDGTLVFQDGFQGLTGVDGLLTGPLYGQAPISWSWWAGTGQQGLREWDGEVATYEDWLVNGTPDSWRYFIGLSWYHGESELRLNLDTPSTYYAGINSFDRIVSLDIHRPLSSPTSLWLAVLGLAGVAGTSAAALNRVRSRRGPSRPQEMPGQ